MNLFEDVFEQKHKYLINFPSHPIQNTRVNHIELDVFELNLVQ